MRRTAWKKTRQVFHTAGVPPASGRSTLPAIGCTAKSIAADTNSATANRTACKRAPEEWHADDADFSADHRGSRQDRPSFIRGYPRALIRVFRVLFFTRRA